MKSPRSIVLPLFALFLAAPARAQNKESEAPTPATLTPLEKIEAAATNYIDAEVVPSLAIGILKDGKREFRTFGRTRLQDAASKPTPDTLYEIGSVTKVFTSLVFADAITHGKVALDTKLKDVVPKGIEVPADDDIDIELVHLATHSSGLPRMPGNFAPRNPTDPYSDYDAKRLYAGLSLTTPARAPGVAYEYSNFAMALLGQVLVDIEGEADYESLVAKRVLGPFGMKDTHVALDEAAKARLALPYDADLTLNANWNLFGFAGAGALRSTARDMLEFCARELDPPAELEKAVALTQTQHYEDPKSKVRLGLGWHISPADVHWHNGETGGYHSFVAISKSQHCAVVVLANAPTREVDTLADFAMALLLGKEPPTPAPFRPAKVEDELLKRLVGRYKLSPTLVFTITFEPGSATRSKGLYAQLTGQPAFRVYAESESKYRYRAVDAQLSFESKDGVASAVVLHQNGEDHRAERMAD